jgi:hypothetical protein
MLIGLALWQTQLRHVGHHRELALYFLLAVALAIPARFLALAGAHGRARLVAAAAQKNACSWMKKRRDLSAGIAFGP